MPTVTFIVVNYFTADLVVKLVESIELYFKNYTYEILVGNNSCSDDENRMLAKLQSKTCQIFQFSDNHGFVKANNVLFEQSKGEIVILINPDAVLLDSGIEKIVKMLIEDAAIGVMGPKLLNDDLSYQVSFYKFPTMLGLIREHILLSKKHAYEYAADIDTVQDVEVIKGACLCFNRECITDGYLFDENLIMYSEEVDLCHRVYNSGKRNIYFPEVEVLHYGEKSSSQKEYSEYSLFHYYRSKFIYFKKYSGAAGYACIAAILIMSLIEKSMLLFVFGKRGSAKMHFHVLRKILNEFLRRH